MKKTSLWIIGGLAVVAASWAAYMGLQAPSAGPSAADGGGAGVNAGKTAPGFVLPAYQGGKSVSLAEYKGKVVLVNFWATWCPPCRQEVPDFVKVQQDLRPKGFEIVGISLDDGPEPVVGFVKEQGVNYAVAMGNSEVAQQYGGVRAIPTSFLLDREGKVVQQFQGAIDAETLRQAIQPLL
jgi:cytochrome c biogenesis protein CcmG/thiol:disulfide interchange protein DsbE